MTREEKKPKPEQPATPDAGQAGPAAGQPEKKKRRPGRPIGGYLKSDEIVEEGGVVRLTVRWDARMVNRLRKVGRTVGLEVASTVRLIVAEHLHEYERRAKGLERYADEEDRTPDE